MASDALTGVPVSSISMAFLVVADRPGQGHSGGGAEQADLHAGGGEGSGLGGDGQIAGGDQLAARGGGQALHLGDHRLGQQADGLHNLGAQREDSGVASASRSIISFRSWPELNTGPSDRRTTTRTASSILDSRNSSLSSLSNSVDRALRRPGC